MGRVRCFGGWGGWGGQTHYELIGWESFPGMVTAHCTSKLRIQRQFLYYTYFFPNLCNRLFWFFNLMYGCLERQFSWISNSHCKYCDIWSHVYIHLYCQTQWPRIQQKCFLFPARILSTMSQKLQPQKWEQSTMIL